MAKTRLACSQTIVLRISLEYLRGNKLVMPDIVFNLLRRSEKTLRMYDWLMNNVLF